MSPFRPKPSFLENAPGPTPWYWKNFPVVTGTAGEKFAWKFHGETGEFPYLVTFESEHQPDKPLLALNSYCTPFLVPPASLGLWCPEGRNLRFVAFDPERLKAFSYSEIAGWFKNSSDRIYSGVEPIADFEISVTLAAGTHPIEVPEPLRSVSEVLAPVSYPAKEPGDPVYAIFALYLSAGLVEVLPQKWFTLGKSDVGYEWITRAVRNPKTHRIVGDGFRIRAFELDESGTDIAHWFAP